MCTHDITMQPNRMLFSQEPHTCALCTLQNRMCETYICYRTRVKCMCTVYIVYTYIYIYIYTSQCICI